MSETNCEFSRLPIIQQVQSQPTNQAQSSVVATANNRSVSIAETKQKILQDIEHQLKNDVAPEDKKALISAVIKDLEKTYLTPTNNNPTDPTAWEWESWENAIYNPTPETPKEKIRYSIEKRAHKNMLPAVRILSKTLTEEQIHDIVRDINKAEKVNFITPTYLYQLQCDRTDTFMQIIKILSKYGDNHIPATKFIEQAIRKGLLEETIINKVFSSVQNPAA